MNLPYSKPEQNGSHKSKNDGEQSYFRDSDLTPENIVEQLSSFTPSKQLLELLQKKILHYEKEYDVLKQKLNEYMCISDEKLQVETDALSKEEEIASLLAALSDSQDCIFQEREYSVKLESELEHYKIEKEKAAQGIQHLLDTTDGKLHDEIVYIFQEPFQLSISQRLLSSRARTGTTAATARTVNTKTSSDNEANSAKKKASTSKSAFANETSNKHYQLMKERIEAMKKDIEISRKEAEHRCSTFEDKIRKLALDLHRAEHNLKDSNCELLDTKKQLCRVELLAQAQFDNLLKTIKQILDCFTGEEDVCYVIKKISKTVERLLTNFSIEPSAADTATNLEDMNDGKVKSGNKAKKTSIKDRQDINFNVAQLKEIHRFYDDRGIACEYRDLYKKLDEDLKYERAHREAYILPYQTQNEQLVNDLKILKSRLNKVEMYRKLQMEGFLTDIKNLTEKIQNMDNKVSKLLLSQVPCGRDEAFLKATHTSAKYSKRLSEELTRLKAKLYQVESELRHL